ncbi:MAG: glycosyltransferase [archaeon]
MKPEVSIVLPTYNEKKNLERLIPGLESMIKEERLKAEIIVVDDSSPDGTADFARGLDRTYKNIHVIVRKKKQGIGPALVAGYNHAKGGIIASIDVDSFAPSDVAMLIRQVKKGSDLVVGSRYASNARYEKKRFKTYIKHFISVNGNKLTKLLTGIDVNDFSLNCRAMTKACWQAIAKYPKETGSAMLLEMIWFAHKKGFKVTDFPVVFKDRQYGKSKMNLVKQPVMFFYTLLRMTLRRTR